ncbi:hypothetical protein DFQ30_010646 [Apophysomyces sp. BC1015]|nr:hypothetical protein DFQ30_010646 [Apophysomyces sp. BC1015]
MDSVNRLKTIHEAVMSEEEAGSAHDIRVEAGILNRTYAMNLEMIKLEEEIGRLQSLGQPEPEPEPEPETNISAVPEAVEQPSPVHRRRKNTREQRLEQDEL